MRMYHPAPTPSGLCSQHPESWGLHPELSRAAVVVSVSPCEQCAVEVSRCCGARCTFRTKPAPTLHQAALPDLGPETPHGARGGIAESLTPSQGYELKLFPVLVFLGSSSI